jgi:hypothetical protein
MQTVVTVYWRQIGSSLGSPASAVLTTYAVVSKMQSVVFSTFPPIVRLWRARRRVDGVSSGGFTVKLMKLTL